jgi:putative membrane protein
VTLNTALATADAALSATSIACMLAAYRAIRSRPRRVRRHRNLMIAGVSASAAFLILFVYRFARVGFGRFPHGGAWKGLYLGVLYAHEPFAVINVPLVLAALGLGLARSDAAHREIAPWAFWIWLFAASTGVLIYALLYLA